MMFEGAVFVSLVVDSGGALLADPGLKTQGVFEDEDEPCREIAARVRAGIETLAAPRRRDDAAVREAARLAVRRAIKRDHGKRPTIAVDLIRL